MQLMVVPLSQDFVVQGNETGFDDWGLAVMAMVGKFLFPRGISYFSSCVVKEREEKKTYIVIVQVAVSFPLKLITAYMLQ